MNKQLLSALLFYLSGISFLSAQSCSIFYDGFESGTFSPSWTFGSGSYTYNIPTATPAVGTHYMELASSTSNAFYEGASASMPMSQPAYISFYVRSNTVTGANTYFVAGDANMPTDNGILFCYFNASSGLRFFNTAGYNYPVVANTWYHVEIKDINYTTRNMDIYVDNNLFLTDFAFRSPTATGFDRVEMFSLVPSTSLYDEIVFGYRAPLITNADITPVTCFGDADGSIDVTVDALPVNGWVTYTWSNGATTTDISGLAPAYYTLQIQDSVGCITTDSFMVYEPLPITAGATVSQPACYGDSTGSVDLTTSGGTPGTGYTYSWNNGQTTEDITGVPAGNYVVTVNDSLGCNVTDTFAVVQPNQLSTNNTVFPVNCNGNDDGEIIALASGGTPGYAYSWSNGQTTPHILSLSPGSYTLTITDTNGCMLYDTVEVTEPAVITTSSVVTNDDGTGNGAIDLTATGGTAGYTYIWSNSAVTEDINGLSAGTYVVIVTDNNNCTVTDTISVLSTAGLDDDFNVHVSVYPNPFTQFINISLSQVFDTPLTCELMDINGRIFFTGIVQPGNKQYTLPVSEELASGSYLLRIKNADRNIVFKMLKK